VRLHCIECGKSVSNEVPEETVLRAVAVCPECVEHSWTASAGVLLIADKARTNREHKGYTPEHDDLHDLSELIHAALAYANVALLQDYKGDNELAKERPTHWPFEPDAWKPSDDPIRNLVHAGALIVAEIERLQRAQARKEQAS
jgi:hypothetical protein